MDVLPEDLAVYIVNDLAREEEYAVCICLEAVNKLFSKAVNTLNNKLHYAKNIANYAANKGYLNILQWARKSGCKWTRLTCAYAAKGGYLTVLQWLRENECPWSTWVCAYAAEKGHLNVLQWARQNGCPWNTVTCSFAAEKGHLDVLQWARENGCPES